MHPTTPFGKNGQYIKQAMSSLYALVREGITKILPHYSSNFFISVQIALGLVQTTSTIAINSTMSKPTGCSDQELEEMKAELNKIIYQNSGLLQNYYSTLKSASLKKHLIDYLRISILIVNFSDQRRSIINFLGNNGFPVGFESKDQESKFKKHLKFILELVSDFETNANKKFEIMKSILNNLKGSRDYLDEYREGSLNISN
jgi:hypothetical protein